MDFCSISQSLAPLTLTSIGLMLDLTGYVIVAASVKWKEGINEDAAKKLEIANTYRDVRERYEKSAAEEVQILERQGIHPSDLDAAKNRDRAQQQFYDNRSDERLREAAEYRYLGIRIEKVGAKIAMACVIAGTVIQFVDSLTFCLAS